MPEHMGVCSGFTYHNSRQMVGGDGDRVLCNVVQMKNKILPKGKNVEQKEEHTMCAHITLTSDVFGVKVI